MQAPRPRDVLLRRLPSDDEGESEEAAWQKHRHGQRRSIEFEPKIMARKRRVAAWQAAIAVLDDSEVKLRDLIERELAPFTEAGTVPLHEVEAIVSRLMTRIGKLRKAAMKKAFRIVRERLGNRKILERSLAAWAQQLWKEDTAEIDAAIRSSLISGFDAVHVAQKVVGTVNMQGVDGVTEHTRHKLGHLGLAAIRETMRKSA